MTARERAYEIVRRFKKVGDLDWCAVQAAIEEAITKEREACVTLVKVSAEACTGGPVMAGVRGLLLKVATIMGAR